GFCSHGPVRIVRLGKKDFRSRDVSKSRDAVITECRIDYHAMIVDYHAFKQCRTDALCDRAVNLSASLHGIDDRTGVICLNALKDTNFACHAMHGDTEPMHEESCCSRGVVSLARNLKLVAKWRPCEKILQRD